jgi:hypothetical protein
VRAPRSWGKLKEAKYLPEWRNWQTHGTQNPAFFTEHVGSTPTSGTTNCFYKLQKIAGFVRQPRQSWYRIQPCNRLPSPPSTLQIWASGGA